MNLINETGRKFLTIITTLIIDASRIDNALKKQFPNDTYDTGHGLKEEYSFILDEVMKN